MIQIIWNDDDDGEVFTTKKQSIHSSIASGSQVLDCIWTEKYSSSRNFIGEDRILYWLTIVM